MYLLLHSNSRHLISKSPSVNTRPVEMSGMVWLSSGVQNFQGHPGMICFRCFRCFAELRHSTLRRAPDLPQVSRPANKQARNTPTRTKVAVEIQRCFQSFVQLWKGSETAIEAIKSHQIPWKTSIQNNSNTIHFETFRIVKTSCDIHFHSNSFQRGCLVLRLKRRTKARQIRICLESRVGWIDSLIVRPQDWLHLGESTDQGESPGVLEIWWVQSEVKELLQQHCTIVV